jgi:hypothetical protein
MGSRSRGMKAIIMVAAVAILALAIGVAAPATAVTFNDADFGGYATGNVLFAGALSQGTGADELKLVNVTEGFTGAGVDSNGLSPAIHNEMNRLVVPATAAKKTYGRGSGVELGVEKGPDDPNDLELQIAHAAAPPDSSEIQDLLGPLSAPPLLYASALHGEANANWSNTSTCVLGKDLSNGTGNAADLQLLDTGTAEGDKLGAPLVATDADPAHPERSVAWSKSRTYLTPQTGPNAIPGHFGLTSEVRMTIAPVTLGDAITVEFLGEWVLKVTAGGVPGSSSVHYGPGEVSPQTHVLRIINGNDVPFELTLQQLLGDTGLTPPSIPGILELAVGEDPRAIGGDADSSPSVSATAASAAVDVVRLKLADGALGDIRLGHMEVKAHVPAGGIDCGIPVTKSASPVGVTVNQDFTVTIKIDNPFGCDLTHVKVVDVVTTKGGARFQVIDTDPNANTIPDGDHLENGVITWNDIGAIPKGGTKSVRVSFKAQNVNGEGGEIIDIANVSALLSNCTGEGNGNELVGKSLPLHVPVVLKLKLPPTGVGTSATAVLGALTLLSLAVVSIRQLRRTH